jgi:hypothetical protein
MMENHKKHIIDGAIMVTSRYSLMDRCFEMRAKNMPTKGVKLIHQAK